MRNHKSLKDAIRSIPDFPVEGIMFRDVTTLMKNAGTFSDSCEKMVEASNGLGPFEFVAGIEARGFIYGSVIAQRCGAGLVLIRKPGKLPAEKVSQEYALEYGIDRIEMHRDSVMEGAGYLVVDDLLATGGTAEATCRLIESEGGVVVGCVFLVELPDLGGRERLGKRRVVSLIEFEGE